VIAEGQSWRGSRQFGERCAAGDGHKAGALARASKGGGGLDGEASRREKLEGGMAG